MRKSSKGFTLIELLAIIVILAIIALITMPVILNVIEKSRKNAAVDKAWGTIDAVRVAYATAQASSSDAVGVPYTVYFAGTVGASSSENNTTTGAGSGVGYVMQEQVKASGDNSSQGWVTIDSDGIITAYMLKFGNYYCSTVKANDLSKLDATSMTCDRNKSKVTVSKLTAGTDYVSNSKGTVPS